MDLQTREGVVKSKLYAEVLKALIWQMQTNGVGVASVVHGTYQQNTQASFPPTTAFCGSLSIRSRGSQSHKV